MVEPREVESLTSPVRAECSAKVELRPQNQAAVPPGQMPVPSGTGVPAFHAASCVLRKSTRGPLKTYSYYTTAAAIGLTADTRWHLMSRLGFTRT